MHNTTVILLGFAIIACAFARHSKRPQPAWFKQLRGWQKLLGLIAIILALLILLNPDLLVLGFLGDTTFIDLFVLALSLQMLSYVQWAWRGLSSATARTFRWVGIPSPGLRFLMAVLVIVVASATSSIQKIVHRFLT